MKKKKYALSDETENEIKRLLREYDPEKVESFILLVGLICPVMDAAKKHRPAWTSRRKNYLDHLKSVVDEGNKIIHKFSDEQASYVGNPQLVDLDLVNQYIVCDKAIYQLQPTIQKLAGILENLLESEKKGRGHPKADENGLVTRLAMAYDAVIDRPYPYKDPFPKIVELIFVDEDEEGKSHIKAIRQALENLKSLKSRQIPSNDIKHKNR